MLIDFRGDMLTGKVIADWLIFLEQGVAKCCTFPTKLATASIRYALYTPINCVVS